MRREAYYQTLFYAVFVLIGAAFDGEMRNLTDRAIEEAEGWGR